MASKLNELMDRNIQVLPWEGMKASYMPSGNKWLVLSCGQVGSSKSYILILMNGAREVTFLMPIYHNACG